MGPVGELSSTEAKLFASAYAIISDLVFITVVDIVLSPVVQRLLHRFHFKEDSDRTEQ
jgi:hypothetical protein